MNTPKIIATLVISAFMSSAQTVGAEDMKGMAMKPAASPADKAFAGTMKTMMDGMHVKPTGKPDEDFARMMIPHHQGAIDMAQVELRYGHNEQLRRIAQEIIVEQQQEITAMRLALGQPLPPSAPAPDQGQGRAPANAVPVQPASSTTMPMPMRMDQEMK